jgi:hypothetical protein
MARFCIRIYVEKALSVLLATFVLLSGAGGGGSQAKEPTERLEPLPYDGSGSRTYSGVVSGSVCGQGWVH